MCKKLLLIGGGGHCKSVLDSILESNEYDKIAIIDMPSKIGSDILGIEIIGSDDDLKKLYSQGYKYAFVTIGSVGNTKNREKAAKAIADIGFIVPNIISTTAVLGRDVSLGKGIYIGKNAVINSSVNVGDFSIINSCALIEHDCSLGGFTHISPGTVLCGQVNVGGRVHIGANSTVRQGIHIGDNSVIGIGSVVVSDIGADATAYGNPCREVH